jgi:uncharacterized protein
MLGRLARYLRIVGLDTAYEPGLDDDEVVRRVSAEGRTLVTRDRALARRAGGSVLLSSLDIADQWRELRSRYPTLPNDPRFARCTLCNGKLESVPAEAVASLEPSAPSPVVSSGVPLFRCASCGHVYWEGSHTASVRRRLAQWAEGTPP